MRVGQQFGLIRSSHGCRTTENQIDLSAIAAVTDSPEGGAIGSRAGAHAVDPVETAVLGLATESGAVSRHRRGTGASGQDEHEHGGLSSHRSASQTNAGVSVEACGVVLVVAGSTVKSVAALPEIVGRRCPSTSTYS